MSNLCWLGPAIKGHLPEQPTREPAQGHSGMVTYPSPKEAVMEWT
ncbi:hypothetical protein NFI96_001736, partial [Prochilodus magdalenae]